MNGNLFPSLSSHISFCFSINYAIFIMVSERGDDKAKEVTPKTSDEGGEETEVLPGCIDMLPDTFMSPNSSVMATRGSGTFGLIWKKDLDREPKCVYRGCTYNMSKQLVDMKEKEQLYDFLMGLDDEFVAVKSQILSSKRTPSLD
nr:uncharacterized protein LOC109192306 [Ipomoea trifida]